MEIDEDIETKEEELEALKKEKVRREMLTTLKKLNEYTNEEKIVWFNNQYLSAMKTLISKLEGEYHEDNDDAHYAWEDKMDILGKGVWKLWNKSD